MTAKAPTTYCSGCGAPVAGEFCGVCGTRLTGAGGRLGDGRLDGPTRATDVEAVSFSGGPTPQPGRGPLRMVTLFLGALVACLLGVLGYVVLRGRGSELAASGITTSSAAGATSSPSSVTSSQTTPTEDEIASHEPKPTESETSETRSPGAIALAELKSLRRDGLAGLRLDGRWVIQLASKFNGVSDKSLVAANGSHVFYYPDIVAEYRDLEQRMAGYGYPTMMLLASDFGSRQRPENRTIWVTLTDPGGISNFESGQYFCAQIYPELSGRDRENVCMPRRFIPPGD